MAECVTGEGDGGHPGVVEVLDVSVHGASDAAEESGGHLVARLGPAEHPPDVDVRVLHHRGVVTGGDDAHGRRAERVRDREVVGVAVGEHERVEGYSRVSGLVLGGVDAEACHQPRAREPRHHIRVAGKVDGAVGESRHADSMPLGGLRWASVQTGRTSWYIRYVYEIGGAWCVSRREKSAIA